MPNLHCYLTFDGNCEDAFNFYRSVFGGEFGWFGRFGDIPGDGSENMSEEEKKRIMHVSLPIGTSTLMGSDTMPGFVLNQGNNFNLSYHSETEAGADEIFAKLSEGGEVTSPIKKEFWGSYFGMVRDKFGISWMVSSDENNKGE